MRANCKRVVTDSNGCVPVTILVIGMMDNNCFIVSDGREEGAPALVVDPAGDPEAIKKALGWLDLQYIVCTHDHNDHLVGLPELAKAMGAKVVSSVADSKIIERGQGGYFGDWDAVAPVHVDRKVKDGEAIKLGSLEFEVLAYSWSHQGWHLPVSEGIRWQAGHPFFGRYAVPWRDGAR